MTALQHAKVERRARDSLSRLLAGQSGVLIAAEIAAATRDRDRKPLSASAAPQSRKAAPSRNFEIEEPPTG